MVLFTMHDMKWYNLTANVLVSTRFLLLVEITMQILLSSKTLHINIGAVLGICKFFDWSSDSKLLTTKTSQSAA